MCVAWSIIAIGKWKGENKTLPQIVLSDPDWFFWAYENGVFDRRYAAEAERIFERARSIRISPGKNGERRVAEYYEHPPTGRFGGVDLVPATQPPHEGGTATWRRSVIDLSAPRSLREYDKTGCAILLSDIRPHLFPGRKRLTRQVCEDFFDNDANFVLDE